MRRLSRDEVGASGPWRGNTRSASDMSFHIHGCAPVGTLRRSVSAAGLREFWCVEPDVSSSGQGSTLVSITIDQGLLIGGAQGQTSQSIALTPRCLHHRQPALVPQMPRLALLRLVLLVSLLAAAQPVAAHPADPLEAVNRRVHAFNHIMRSQVLRPLAELYLSTTPVAVRRGIANALANLKEPITAASGLAAGDVDVAWNAAARFGINSTLGIAGTRDRAAEMGYPRRVLTVADAVCRWGVPSGPFVMLPLLGPSTLRDAAALVGTSVALSHVLGPEPTFAWSSGDLFAGYAEVHEQLAQIDAGSIDSYAVYRSTFLQRRGAACPVDRLEDPASAPDQD
jgi:phospholipid-binding lipoprotein MlaA